MIAPSDRRCPAIVRLGTKPQAQGVLRLALRHDSFDAGIGISTGIVVAGNVRAEERYEYTAIGDPVNEAARLAEVAKGDPGRLIASGRSLMRAQAPDGALWREAGERLLRGRRTATALYTPCESYATPVSDDPQAQKTT